jgi:SET domain-containing protein
MKYLKLFENFDWDFETIDLDESDYLQSKPSQIPNSGMGLFTTIDIEPGEIISKFIGEILTAKEYRTRKAAGEDDYFMNLPSGKTLDCRMTKCFAKYANDAEGLKTPFKNNSFISMNDEGDVVIVAKKPIRAGEEIFVSYGKNYWQNFKSKNK